MMQKLQLPEYSFRLREERGRMLIFDEIRRRFVALTPEEWVRQHFLHYLVAEKGYPASLMAVEKKVNVNGLSQRFDLLVYDRKGAPLLVAEFKAPGVAVTQAAFDQAVRYNSALKVPLILVSNGLQHFVCRVDYAAHTAGYLREVPHFDEV